MLITVTMCSIKHRCLNQILLLYIATYGTAQFKLDICTCVIVELLEGFIETLASYAQPDSSSILPPDE